MQVFVECQAPGCASVLQVVVPPTHRKGNGEVLVRCGECSRLLRVQLPQELLQAAAAEPEPTAHSQLQPPARLPQTPPPAGYAAEYQQHAVWPPGGQQQYGSGAGPTGLPFPAGQPHQHQLQQTNAVPYMAQSGGQAPPMQGVGVRRRRVSSSYHEYISREMKRLKASQPGMDHQAAFKLAASSWVTSGAKAAAEHAKGQQQAADQARDQVLAQQEIQHDLMAAATAHLLPAAAGSDIKYHSDQALQQQQQQQQQAPAAAPGAMLQTVMAQQQPYAGVGHEHAHFVPAAAAAMQLLSSGGAGPGSDTARAAAGFEGDAGPSGVRFAAAAASDRAAQTAAAAAAATAGDNEWGVWQPPSAAEQDAPMAVVGAAGLVLPQLEQPAVCEPAAVTDNPAGASVLPSATNLQQPPATAAQPNMAPPPARRGSNTSDAVNNDPALTATAAAAAAAPGADTGAAPASMPAAGSTDGVAAPSTSSGSQAGQVTPAAMTLQETWEALCMRHSPATTSLPADAAAQPAHPTAGQPAPPPAAAAAAAPVGLDAVNPTGMLLPARQQLPVAQYPAVDGGLTLAGAPAAATHNQQQQVRHQHPLSRPTAHQVTTELIPTAAAAAAAAAGAPAGHAPLLSEGSSLASWTSSGLSPALPGPTASTAAADVATAASPGSLSGAAGSSMPSILRHNSAPITTGFLPRGQSKAVGYSITTAGPAQPGQG